MITQATKKHTAFHWSRNDDRLGYGDGRKIVLGKTLSVKGKPEKCKHGLHGSESIMDALFYASGTHLWVVEIWGAVDTTDRDKICGQHRKAIAQYGDLMFLIVDFAKWCAVRSAEYAKSAESVAEYTAKSAKSAKKERLAQEGWWYEKLAQIK